MRLGRRVVALVALGALVAAGCEPEDRGADPSDATVATTRQLRRPTSETNARPSSPSEAVGAAPISVSSVTDGDTLVVSDGRTVRLAQVDAPETSECFGSASTAALRKLALGRQVALHRRSGPATDPYGRTLADVIVDGRSVNEAVVREGAAEWYEEFAHEDAALAGRLRAAESAARQEKLGLWSACRGAAAAPITPARFAPATDSTTPANGNCHPAYPDDCLPPPPPDLDCPDIGHRVHVNHTYGDPHRLDADGDGVGCESYG